MSGLEEEGDAGEGWRPGLAAAAGWERLAPAGATGVRAWPENRVSGDAVRRGTVLLDASAATSGLAGSSGAVPAGCDITSFSEVLGPDGVLRQGEGRAAGDTVSHAAGESDFSSADGDAVRCCCCCCFFLSFWDIFA